MESLEILWDLNTPQAFSPPRAVFGINKRNLCQQVFFTYQQKRPPNHLDPLGQSQWKASSYSCQKCHVRASPRVWQIELPSLIFDKNVKNTPPTIWQKTWQFLATWEKPAASA